MNSTKQLNRRTLTNYLIFAILFVVYIKPIDLKSQDISTVGEIYNYEINDIFHHEFHGGNGSEGETWITNIEIINKYYSQDSTTLFYVRDVDRKVISSWNPNWTYSYFIDTVSYVNLDSLIESGDIDTVYSDSDYYNGRLINVNTYNDEYTYNYSKYVNGCGSAEWYSYNSSGGESEANLVYYKKGSEEWGQPLIVGFNNFESEDREILIFPNPAKTSIQIEADFESISVVSVYSVHGKFIDIFELDQKTTILDISKLNPSIYILEFKLENQNIYKRLIKQ